MTKKRRDSFTPAEYLFFSLITLAVFFLCACIGSVNVEFRDTLASFKNMISRSSMEESGSILISLRIPRIICVALVGAALSLSGASMQGLLRNPLAEGSTLGVSSGASLGAVIAIAFGGNIPGFRAVGSTFLAMLFAFIVLVLVLTLAYKLDSLLTTNTIILIGVVFSMFCTSMISLVTAFAGDKVRTITFWTMGSLSGSDYSDVLTMLAALLIFAAIILRYSRELNAFAIGEDNARHVGIDVFRVKMAILISASALIGVCVSIGGSIGFVGLVIPHITRMMTGPNHKRLLPASMYLGAVFLMLADLLSRTIVRPLELPIGVITSIIGTVMFIYIFYITRKVK